MDDLVKRLSKGDHPVIVGGHDASAEEFKAMIDRDYVLVKFTKTKGGTELGFPLDKERSKWEDADFEKGKGSVTVAGNLNLNYVDVKCVAEIDLSSLEGKGHLEVMEEAVADA